MKTTKSKEMEKGAVLSFIPDRELRARIEAMAKHGTRAKAHQVHHLVKLGLMLVDAAGDEGLDICARFLEGRKVA